MPQNDTLSDGSAFDVKQYQVHLSVRYLKSRFSSIAALLAITFGVAVILILLAIMGGYVAELRTMIRGQESDLILVGPERYSITRVHRLERLVQSVSNVRATAPYIDSLAMYRSSTFNPCQLRGIDPEKQTLASDFGAYVITPDELAKVLPDFEKREGSNQAVDDDPRYALEALLRDPDRKPLEADEVKELFSKDFARKILAQENPAMLTALQGATPPVALVGAQLLLSGDVFVGQLLTVVTVNPERPEPISRPFLVVGAFKSGDFEVDSRTICVHVDALKSMLKLFDPTLNSYRYEGLRIALEDASKLEETKDAIELAVSASPHYNHLKAFRWEDLRKNLLRAVHIEKFIVFFLLVVVQSFAGFMILLMLTLIVIDKTRDMGVLLALGATPGGLTKVFLANGLLLTVAGTILGLGLGYLFCININAFHDWIHRLTGVQLFDPRIYNMDRIPITIRPQDVLLSVATPLTFGFLASLAPAIWASRRDPIKAIHFE